MEFDGYRSLEVSEEAKNAISLAFIPIVAGAVGYFTNVLALKMTFYPLDFKGVNLKR